MQNSGKFLCSEMTSMLTLNRFVGPILVVTLGAHDDGLFPTDELVRKIELRSGMLDYLLY